MKQKIQEAIMYTRLNSHITIFQNSVKINLVKKKKINLVRSVFYGTHSEKYCYVFSKSAKQNSKIFRSAPLKQIIYYM